MEGSDTHIVHDLLRKCGDVDAGIRLAGDVKIICGELWETLKKSFQDGVVVHSSGGVVGRAVVVVTIGKPNASRRLQENVIGGLLPACGPVEEFRDRGLLLRGTSCLTVAKGTVTTGCLVALPARARHSKLSALAHLPVVATTHGNRVRGKRVVVHFKRPVFREQANEGA